MWSLIVFGLIVLGCLALPVLGAVISIKRIGMTLKAARSKQPSLPRKPGVATQIPPHLLRKPKSKEEEKELLFELLDYVHEMNELRKANPAPKKDTLSVRLVPQVPIRSRELTKAWIGGGAQLPNGIEWPEIDGKNFNYSCKLIVPHYLQVCGMGSGLGMAGLQYSYIRQTINTAFCIFYSLENSNYLLQSNKIALYPASGCNLRNMTVFRSQCLLFPVGLLMSLLSSMATMIRENQEIARLDTSDMPNNGTFSRSGFTHLIGHRRRS